MLQRDVWNQVLLSLEDYARRLRAQGPVSHRPPRSGPRMACSMPVRLTGVQGTAVDFSASGIRVRLAGPVPPDEPVEGHIEGNPAESDLGVQLRPIWTRLVAGGEMEAGYEFVGFDERPPEEVARFFERHPGLSRHAVAMPVRREIEMSPAVMLAAETGGVRKGYLLRLTRVGLALACRNEMAPPAEVQTMLQLPAGHLRASGTVTSCQGMAQEGFYRIEVRFREHLTPEQLQAFLPVLLEGARI